MQPSPHNRAWCAAVLLAASLLPAVTASAAGLLTPSDGSLPALEIRDHAVHVVIEDGYAVTTVEQLFHNPHDRDLEALYSFPVPNHGAVAEFTVWIDGRPVTGEVLEKEQARRVYEEEKAARRDAGLTEKDGYRTFEIRVQPVRAGQDTRIRLVYLQPAAVDTGVGRYVYPLEEGGVDERKLAFWTAHDQVTGRFEFDLLIKSAYPVAAVRVPGNGQAQVTHEGDGQWRVRIDGSGATETEGASAATAVADANPTPAGSSANAPAFTLDKDVVVYWRHQVGLPGSVDLVADKPDAGERGTFMMVVTPGDDLQPITEGRDWVFVLDVSGSMQGKYATLADGVERALHKLRPDDRFRIVLFNDDARELTHGFVTATPEAVARYSTAVRGVTPGGSTNMYDGLKEGLDALDADRTSAIVLVTDGVANVGETAQRKFVDLIQRKDVRLFTLVMGNSANRPLLAALTKASGGFALSISNSDDIVGQLLSATSKVTHAALHGVEIDIIGVKNADITPRDIGSLYRGQQLVVFGHYWGEGMADVRLRGRISGAPVEYRTQFAFPAVATDNPELARLWAYAAIEEMTSDMEDFGEKADLREAVVDLGVEYGLVTDYTSMVVLREEEYDRRGIQRTNRDRRAVEQAAAQQRAQRAAVSRRVDQQAPMYSTPRPTYGGGSGDGAFGPWGLLLVVALLWAAIRRHEGQGRG